MSYKPFTTKYTWQIIDDIKEYLEETNKDQTTLDTLDLCHLIGEIEELNDKNRELFNKNKQLKDQLQQKENIIKKVKNFLDNNTQFDYQGGDYDNHLMEWYEIINITENNFIRGLYEILDKENKQ